MSIKMRLVFLLIETFPRSFCMVELISWAAGNITIPEMIAEGTWRPCRFHGPCYCGRWNHGLFMK